MKTKISLKRYNRRYYRQQPSADTRCSLEDLPGAIDDRVGRQRESRKPVLAA